MSQACPTVPADVYKRARIRPESWLRSTFRLGCSPSQQMQRSLLDLSACQMHRQRRRAAPRRCSQTPGPTPQRRRRASRRCLRKRNRIGAAPPARLLRPATAGQLQPARPPELHAAGRLRSSLRSRAAFSQRRGRLPVRYPRARCWTFVGPPSEEARRRSAGSRARRLSGILLNT